MADTKVICDRSDLVAIADAVRSKTGTSDDMTLGEIKSNIDNLDSSGGSGNIETCTVTITSTMDNKIWNVVCTILENGEPTPTVITEDKVNIDYGTLYTISNVVVGTVVSFAHHSGGCISITNGEILLANHESGKTDYCIPTVANAIAAIKLHGER